MLSYSYRDFFSIETGFFGERLRRLHRCQLGSLFDINRDDSRYARFVHGYTKKLVRHLHGYLVMGDENELHALGHLFHQIRVTANVGVV